MASKTRPTDDPQKRTNIATATSKATETAETDKTVLYGTGGTDLIPFLRHTRDTTKAAARYTDSPAL